MTGAAPPLARRRRRILVLVFTLVVTLAFGTAVWWAASTPTSSASAPSASPTHHGLTAPVDPDDETVLGVPDGPTVAIPEGAVSAEGQLSVHEAALPAADRLPGVGSWEIDLQEADLTGDVTITFPLQVDDGDPVPLAGYVDEDTGAHVPVEVKVVDGRPTVTTDHFSRWWVQDVREVTARIAQTLRGMVDPFPNARRPQCPGEEELGEDVQVTSVKAETYWCAGRNSRGQTIVMVTNREGHTVEFSATPHLIPEVTEITVSNIVEESALLAKTVSQQPDSPNTFGLIGPGQTRTFTVAQDGRHELDITASDTTVFATAFRIAVDGLLLMAPISDTLQEADVTGAISAAIDAGDCILDLWDPTAEAKRQSGGPTAEQVTTIAVVLVECAQPHIESRLYRQTLNEEWAASKAAVISVVSLALGGVKFILSGFSWILGTAAGDEGLTIIVGPEEDAVPEVDGERIAAASLRGSWKGRLVEPAPPADHLITVWLSITNDDGVLSGKVTYVQLECSGTWTQTRRTTEAAYFTEVLDHDPSSSCPDTSDVTLVKTTENLQITLESPEVTRKLVLGGL